MKRNEQQQQRQQPNRTEKKKRIEIIENETNKKRRDTFQILKLPFAVSDQAMHNYCHENRLLQNYTFSRARARAHILFLSYSHFIVSFANCRFVHRKSRER